MYRSLFITVFLSVSSYLSAQSQFFIGLRGGINGCFVQYDRGTIPYLNLGGNVYQTRMTSRGPSVPLEAEFVYGVKKFRIGYKFEYERILTSSYTFKVINTNVSYADSTGYEDVTQHFFCHNLIMEYVVWDDGKHFKFVPGLAFGYYHGVTSTSIAPYDFSGLNQNRFKIGFDLNLEYTLGQISIVASPHYGIVPIKAMADPNQKGYMHFVGLNVGIRFNCIKRTDIPDNGKHKPKKEYKNPEEDE